MSRNMLYLSLCLCAVVVMFGLFIYGIGVQNRYIDLSNTYDKQTATLESFYDKMWKTIQSQSRITDKMKNDFKEIYVGIMEGRHYDSGGELMKWIREDNPQFDQTAYSKLMTTVEAQRTAFHNEQTIMQGIVKEINDLRMKFPSKFWLSDRPKSEFIPISSTLAKNTMKNRSSDDLHLGD